MLSNNTSKARIFGISGESGTSIWGDIPNIGNKISGQTANIIMMQQGIKPYVIIKENEDYIDIGIPFFSKAMPTLKLPTSRQSHGVYLERVNKDMFNGNISDMVSNLKTQLLSKGIALLGIIKPGDIDNYIPNYERGKKISKPKIIKKKICACKKN